VGAEVAERGRPLQPRDDVEDGRVAEQFDYDPAITTPAGPGGAGGAGFDAQRYTEFQHRLVNDTAPFRPGLVQAAARGWRRTWTRSWARSRARAG